VFVLFNGADENLISQGGVGMLKAQNKGSLRISYFDNFICASFYPQAKLM
jgi:hypothetical protein